MTHEQFITLSYILMVGLFLCLVVQDLIRNLKSLIHPKSKQLPKTVKEPTFTEYMDKKYMTRKDTDNIFPVGISDEEFRKFTIKYLLTIDGYLGRYVEVRDFALDLFKVDKFDFIDRKGVSKLLNEPMDNEVLLSYEKEFIDERGEKCNGYTFHIDDVRDGEITFTDWRDKTENE